MLPLLLTTALFAPADAEPATTPKGPPPVLVVGQVNNKGQFVMRVTVQEIVKVTTKEKVNVNGKEEERTVIRDVLVMKQVEQARDLSKATITDAAGKKLDKKALAKRLEKPAGVIWSSDGKPVDKGYLAMFRSNTVVIVAPVTATGTTPPPFKVEDVPPPKKD